MLIRRLVFLFSLLLNAILLYSLVWGSKGIIAYADLKRISAELEVKIAELDQENLVLSQEIRLLQNDESYLEKVIRKRLNYVKKNEILYIFPEYQERNEAGATFNATKN